MGDIISLADKKKEREEKRGKEAEQAKNGQGYKLYITSRSRSGTGPDSDEELLEEKDDPRTVNLIRTLEIRVRNSLSYYGSGLDVKSAENLYSLDRKNPYALTVLGIAAYTRQDYDGAMGFLERAVKSDTYLMEAAMFRVIFAWELVGDGRLEKDAAVEMMLDSFADHDNDEELLERLLAVAITECDDNRLATAFYDRGMRLNPERFGVYEAQVNALPEPVGIEPAE
jgi:tetratricopeptide (TPR) repeat protein